MIGFVEVEHAYLVKCPTTNSYIPFITIFMNKFSDNKLKVFLFIDDKDDIDTSDNIYCDLNILKLLTKMNGLTMNMIRKVNQFISPFNAN